MNSVNCIILVTFTGYLTTLACGVATAACEGKGQFRPNGPAMSDSEVRTFINAPSGLLENRALDARDGYLFELQVSKYVSTDGDLVRGVLSSLKLIVPRASPQQKVAIGKGLFRGYETCLTSKPEISSALQSSLQIIGDRAVTETYLSSLATYEAMQSSTTSVPTAASVSGLAAGQGVLGVDDSDPFAALSLDLKDPFDPVDALRSPSGQ